MRSGRGPLSVLTPALGRRVAFRMNSNAALRRADPSGVQILLAKGLVVCDFYQFIFVSRAVAASVVFGMIKKQLRGPSSL